MHSKAKEVKEDVLLSAEENIKIINKYLKADKSIDDAEMYYISAVL